MAHPTLHRVLGLPGAIGLGLGSILGTGVFIAIGLGADAAGGWVGLAIVLAGFLATANAMSSAQLAAANPVSGGTYEHAHRLISPSAGFAAGWLFLCAKSASAATAALGVSAYALGIAEINDPLARSTIALGVVVSLTSLVVGGLTRSARINACTVGITLIALLAFILVALLSDLARFDPVHLGIDTPPDLGLLEATALVFVAFTGYGRLATLGEEVRDPRRTIPRAIIVTLIIAAVLFAGVAIAACAVLGVDGLASAGREGVPLESAARVIGSPVLVVVVAVGAIAAMLGVLLNLVLGLSRVALAMGRRGDLPRRLAGVDTVTGSPTAATIAVGVVIASITLVGSIELAWSFSAFTVLLYYAITNVAALRLDRASRLYPRWIAAAGLLACVGLAWWVEPVVWVIGVGMVGVGFGVRAVSRRLGRGP